MSVFIFNYYPTTVIEKLRGTRYFDELTIRLGILNQKPTNNFRIFSENQPLLLAFSVNDLRRIPLPEFNKIRT